MKIIAAIFLTLLIAITSIAQKGNVKAEVIFLDPQPVVRQLPVPAYPKEAGLMPGVRFSVGVTIDTKGNVIFADDPENPYPICKSIVHPAVTALKASVVAAAKKAKFKPVPAQLSGRIEYALVETPAKTSKTAKNNYKLDRLTLLKEDKKGNAAVGTTTQNPDQSSAGVLNGKATALPKPVYPQTARITRPSGPVSVQILITETGEVFSAEAKSGDAQLRKSAETAACGARFSPTLLSGQPVKVSGVITYNFVP